MLQDKFFKPANLDLFRVANTIEEVFTLIEEPSVSPTESKWFETR
jgi:hypothetical protein